MVEEVPDDPADGPVRGDNGPRLPVALHRMQLSTCLRLVDRDACGYVLLPLQGVLHPNVQQASGGGGEERCTQERRRSRAERRRSDPERSKVKQN